MCCLDWSYLKSAGSAPEQPKDFSLHPLAWRVGGGDARQCLLRGCVELVWASLASQEGWPAGRFLAALAEHEIAERSRRRLERHLAEARLPPGKTLDTFDFEAVPVVSKAQVMALAAGDAWLNNGANLH